MNACQKESQPLMCPQRQVCRTRTASLICVLGSLSTGSSWAGWPADPQSFASQCGRCSNFFTLGHCAFIVRTQLGLDLCKCRLRKLVELFTRLQCSFQPTRILDMELPPAAFLSLSCMHGRKLDGTSACELLSPVQGELWPRELPLSPARVSEPPTFSGISYASAFSSLLK